MSVFSAPSQLHDIRFGTDGWRALIAKEFTYKNLHLLLNGLASYILEKHGTSKPLIIGYDARFLADRFANFAAGVINSFGIEVKLINKPVPTPVIAYSARELNSCGALTFTASHNPPEYMGIKYIPEYGGPANIGITNAILEQVNALAPKGGYDGDPAKFPLTHTEIIDPKPVYFKHIRTLINLDAIKAANAKKPCKLIYDPLYGCGIGYTSELLKEAGFSVETLHGNYDANFGGSMPDPKEKRLTELKARILETKADLGAANDGDADRFAFMDDSGNFYPANKSLPIILKYLIEHRQYKGVVARTVATTHLLDEVAHKHKLNVIETAVGFKWLCEIMLREPTVLCAEESGGMSILGHIPEKDGILAILLMAEVLAVTGKKLSELWQEVQNFVGRNYYYDSLDLHIGGTAKEEFMAKFMSKDLKFIAGYNVELVDKTEGAKVYLSNGSWLLARPSGTEEMCRVYFEAHDPQELSKIVNAVQAMVSH